MFIIFTSTDEWDGIHIRKKKIALVYSRQDPGGTSIKKQVEELLAAGPRGPYPLEKHNYELIGVQERLIYADHIDREVSSDLIIFLSRHSSVNPSPSSPCT